MNKIVVENVSKIFGPDPKSVLPLIEKGMGKQEILEQHGHVVGIRNLSLTIQAGETFVVMGLSGSGKSTLIRHFNRLIEPTSGRILVDGEDVLNLTENGLRDLRRHKISMVFQKFGLLPHRTVMENVAYGLVTSGVPRKEAYDRAQIQIDLVDLTGYEGNYPRQLSGGMQQRVGLARALATDADILLMDEAFSALDPVIRNDMQGQLQELQSKLHKTIVFITHDLDEALRLGDHIAILKDGELRQCGTGSEILLNPADDYVARFVRDVNRAKVVTLGSIAQPVESMPREQATPDVCQDRLGASRAVLLTEDDKPAAMLTESYLLANADRSEDWWQNAGKLPAVTKVEGKMTIEEGLNALGETEAPILVVDAEGQPTGVVSRLTAIRALSGAQAPAPT